MKGPVVYSLCAEWLWGDRMVVCEVVLHVEVSEDFVFARVISFAVVCGEEV